MVAITVAVAAVIVLLLPSFASEDPEVRVQFLRNQESEQLYVVRADPVDVAHLEVWMSVDGHANLNGPADTTTVELPARTFVSLTSVSAPLQAGDTISFCADAAGTGIEVQVRDTTPRALLYRNPFSYLRQCA
jgi:hypothetical protein